MQFLHPDMKSMHSDLRRLDLNLLLVFDALCRHRSVSAAAHEMALSPSALSHALARLRQATGDELFVRLGNAMQPTARAEQMAGWVGDALGVMSQGLQRTRHFDPADSDHTFVFAATDYTAFAVLPAFIARMQQQAPRLRFRIVYSSRRVATDDLASGRVDFALGYNDDPAAHATGVEEFDWFSDDYVVIARDPHPRIDGPLSLDQYLAERHVVVTPWNEPRGMVDHVLERLGLARDVAVQLPTVLAAPFIIADSALLMTVPHRAALALRHAAPIRILDAPFEIPRYTVKVYTHAQRARTDAHQWLRAQLLQAVPAFD
ncbi:LysR family transcriptional regulator [Burkholderia sp. FERM BP-3421]|uniref:LysR family transcriptional regulator n=1 Tax=Burkholderia sp. FERM BP-3421 TaxID=1494466 RepID=UPI00235F2170|nr:LysR family transcriptional regulator [Burkholderia sp. FERM BP-3421]WDD94912.1 LysR family transcriptional regulator [Burkholderia sp. FERM BP-3421]